MHVISFSNTVFQSTLFHILTNTWCFSIFLILALLVDVWWFLLIVALICIWEGECFYCNVLLPWMKLGTGGKEDRKIGDTVITSIYCLSWASHGSKYCTCITLLLLTTTPWGGCCCYPHFTYEDTEMQKVKRPKSYCQSMVELRLGPKKSGFIACALSCCIIQPVSLYMTFLLVSLSFVLVSFL